MPERFCAKGAVFLFLTRTNTSGQLETLLQLRQNTGYMDGHYDFACSGHIEQNETLEQAMVREAKEEIGLNLNVEDIKPVFFNYQSRTGYFRTVFRPTTELQEIPHIMEPNKCSDLRWFTVKNLPENATPLVQLAVKNILSNIHYVAP